MNIRALNPVGIGFFGIIGLAFIILKLAGSIAWPWWLVLAPIWWPIASVLAFLAIGTVVIFTVAMVLK